MARVWRCLRPVAIDAASIVVAIIAGVWLM